MLGEPKKLNYPGRKEDILFFLQSIVGANSIRLDDIRILCRHAPAKYQLHTDYLIEYCSCFGWIQLNDKISASKDILSFSRNETQLNNYLVESTLNSMFCNKIFTANMFVFDVNNTRVLFRNELLPLSYASIRNVLVSQGFLVVERDSLKTVFSVHPDYEVLLSRFCQKSMNAMTLAQLQSRLEANAIAGAKAESFVLDFERRRIQNPTLKNQIRQISNIDVCAGYDILSFESDSSNTYDRFIEVKAISRNQAFFWSKNELEIARLQGDKYCLYLVNLSKIGDSEYAPIIIQNPALSIMRSPDWLIEPESYHVQKISC